MLTAWLPDHARSQQTEQRLQQQKAQTQQAREELRARIEQLQRGLQEKSAQQARASDQLKRVEQAISDVMRRLKGLEAASQEVQVSLSQLNQQIEQQEAKLQKDREILAEQLRAQYQSGLSPWSALLAGQDPQALGRELGYLSFVAQARAQTIERLRLGVAELSALKTDQIDQQNRLTQQTAEIKAEQSRLNEQRGQRTQLLARLQEAIAAERAQQEKLAADERELSELIVALNREIERFRANERQVRTNEQAVLAQLPQGKGLKPGIAMPVQGPFLARYGSNRPDGGDWRGVLISAPEGTPVRAVAPGTVVYATWLRGFGNLIIVDHGDDFLTIYGNNQSLLKEVGEQVGAGDLIANAGNTGGQLDSALYFEIRYQGVPLDPQLYFKR